MNQTDIQELIRLLKSAQRLKDWELVEEAYDQLQEFNEDVDIDE